jgi:hypothetical protein
MLVRCTAIRSHGADECMFRSDALPSVGYRARHGMVACTPRATWSRSLFVRRRGPFPPPGPSWAATAPHLSLRCACGRPHGIVAHDCLVHVCGLVGPAPLRIVDAPSLPTALTVLTRPLCLPWELRRGSYPPKNGPCDLSRGGTEAVAPRIVVPPAHLVGHAFQGCCPPQLPHTCWRPFGHGVAHARRLKSAHTWSAKRGRTCGGVICCCW